MSKKRSAKRKVAAVLAVAAVALVAAAGFGVTRGWLDLPASSAAGAATSAPTTENAAGTSAPPAPPAGSDAAAESANPSSGQTVATDEPVVVTGSQVPVVVTYYGWNAGERRVQVGGYVTGVVEEGGTCTLTLTKDGATVTVEGAARPDAVTTACGQLTVSGARLSAGTWQAVLSYASDSATGAAAAVPVEVTP